MIFIIKNKKYMWKLFLMIVLIILIGSIFVIGTIYQNKKVLKDFDLFYSSFLNGRITKVDKYSRGAIFKLNNSSTKYTFYPDTDKNLNEGEIFQYLAQPGDSIYKQPFSDTLILIKDDKTYLYTFKKSL